MKLEAVLFDLDGTLFESQGLYGEAYRRAVLPLLGRPLTREDLRRIRPRSESAFFAAAVQAEHRAAAMEAFRREYEALHDTAFDGLYEGVRALIEGVEALGLRRGVVSGKSRGSWEITARKVDLASAFAVVILDDDVQAPKPDPDGILRAARGLGVDPTATAYLGDTASDMEAAAAAGAWPVLVTWSASEAARRRRALAAARRVDASIAATPEEALVLLRDRSVER